MISEAEWDFLELSAKVDLELGEKAEMVQNLRDRFTQKALKISDEKMNSRTLSEALEMEVDQTFHQIHFARNGH